MESTALTASRLREVLDYNAATGDFVRRKTGKRVGDRSGSGYLTVYVDGKNHNAHRLAWLHFYGERPRFNIDHINGVRTDNRIANLRDLEQSENVRTKRIAKGKSGLIGVSFHKASGKWAARASLAPKAPQTHLGVFDSPEEAAAAASKARAR